MVRTTQDAALDADLSGIRTSRAYYTKTANDISEPSFFMHAAHLQGNLDRSCLSRLPPTKVVALMRYSWPHASSAAVAVLNRPPASG
jgi:hypothetical protein